jgi:hypothetical protein
MIEIEHRQYSPVFILGMPRSGTTMLATKLSQSNDIAVLPETWIFTRFFRQLDELNSVSSYSRLKKNFLASSRFTSLGLDKDLVEKELSCLPNDHVRYFIIGFMEAFRKHSGKLMIGEKTPSNYRQLDKILSVFPSAKIIWVRRNPFAVVSSLVKSPFGYNQVSYATKLWIASERIRQGHESSGVKIHLTEYEDLIRDPEGSFQSICDFLNIEYTSDIFTLTNTDQYKTNDSFEGWGKTHFKRANQKLDAGSIDKWQKDLTETQKQLIFERLISSGLELSSDIPAFHISNYKVNVLMLREFFSLQFDRMRKEISKIFS